MSLTVVTFCHADPLQSSSCLCLFWRIICMSCAWGTCNCNTVSLTILCTKLQNPGAIYRSLHLGQQYAVSPRPTQYSADILSVLVYSAHILNVLVYSAHFLSVLVQFVGPVLAEDANPVPADLAAFLNQGLPDGHAAIFVSMGTLARLSLEELTSMASALSRLPNPVLWKLDPGHLPGTTRAKHNQ